MNRGRVGEERGGKEMDGCPLTVGHLRSSVGCAIYMVEGFMECGMEQVVVTHGDNQSIVHTVEQSTITL
jgi:hypothetical protein